MCTQFSSSGWSSLITIALSSKNLGSNFSRSSSFELSVSILYDTQLLHRCCCCAIEALSVSSQTWYLHNSERFEPRWVNVVVWVIVRVCSVVLRRTVVGVDWRFDNLSGSHHQSHADDRFRSGCRIISQHQQQSFSGLHYKPGRSLKPQQTWYSWLWHHSFGIWLFLLSWDDHNNPFLPRYLYLSAV